MNFERELTELLNKHNQESGSNTPDFVLADYVVQCLQAFNDGVKNRERLARGEKTEGGV